jgi:hypothetical protein
VVADEFGDWRDAPVARPDNDPRLVPCPVCGELTDSLKQYRYFDWCLCLLLHAVSEMTIHRACPPCMRKFILKKCLLNALPANLVWIFVVLPWGMVLIAASYTDGHSRAVLQGVTPTMAVQRENEANERYFRLFMAAMGVATFWVPVVGLIVCFVAWSKNRGAVGWARGVSQWALIASAVATTAVVAFMIWDANRWR